LGKNVVNNLASATMNSALTGAKLEDSLKTALMSAVISAGAGQAASTIGDMTQDSPAVKALAHALAGCMAGAAGTNNSQGCQSGAIGAVVGELAAQWVNPTDDPNKVAKTLELVKVISAAAGALTGDGSAGSVNTAVMTGVNAALNNRMLHPTEANLIKNNAKRYAQERFGTVNPSAQQIEAAQVELANTAQSMLDNNLGVVVPYVGQAADFLAQLKVEYMQQYGSLNLAGTAGGAGGTQQLFYATVEQKNLPWLNQGLADPAITGLIVKTPINPPKTADTLASNRDRLTGLPLDDKGRYEVNLTLGDKSYSPKYFPCATAECVKSGGNLDMSDAGTRAYVKALDQQVFKDIGTGATAATLVTPTGAAAKVLFWLGAAASGGQAAMSDAPFNEGRDEAMKALSEKGGAIVFEELLGHTPGAAARASALINLTGGWDAFVSRVKIDLFGMKSSETKN
jgi:filamentous hemagglutinin